MPKTNSDPAPKAKKPSFKLRIGIKSPLKSFRRAYREDYADSFEAPSLLSHAMTTFGQVFKNWRFFGGLLLVVVIFSFLFIGIMGQDAISGIKATIESSSQNFTGGNGNLGSFAQAGLLLIATVTTGGLNQDFSNNQGVFLCLVFLLIWLATIYFLRYLLAGHKITLRDGLYNAFAPLVSTFVVFAIIAIELIPTFLTIIVYNAAIKTDFLATPFYALIFFAFAFLMLLLSGYLVSSSLIALVAVSAPGLYPLSALRSAHELMFGRRIKFIIRILFLFLIIAFTFVVTMLPIILLDSLLKSSFEIFANIPVISFSLLVVTAFCFIYSSAYIYLYYRRMLEHESK